jgi:hypothetical protein
MIRQSRSLRAGVFLPPFHPNNEDPFYAWSATSS